MVIDHDEARELLPDFALDLLEQEEHGNIVDHLRECDVCLAEAQLYLQGARALSLVAAHEPQALSLRTFVPRVPDGAVERIRTRVLDGPGVVQEVAAHYAAPSREVAEAGSRGGWRLFGRSRAKDSARTATGLLEREPLPGGAFAEASGAASAAGPALNYGRPQDREEFDDFGTDSFEDLFRSPAVEVAAAPAPPPAPAAEASDGPEAPGIEPAIERESGLDWLFGTVETDEPADTSDPSDHLWDEPEELAEPELPAMPETPKHERRVLGRRKDETEPAARADPAGAGVDAAPAAPVGLQQTDPGPPNSQRLAARMRTQAAKAAPPPLPARRRFFGRGGKPEEAPAARVQTEEDFGDDPFFEVAPPAAVIREELAETLGVLGPAGDGEEPTAEVVARAAPDPLTGAAREEPPSAEGAAPRVADRPVSASGLEFGLAPAPDEGRPLDRSAREPESEAQPVDVEALLSGELSEDRPLAAEEPPEPAGEPDAPVAEVSASAARTPTIDDFLSGIAPDEDDQPAAGDALLAALHGEEPGRKRRRFGRRKSDSALPAARPAPEVALPSGPTRGRRFFGRGAGRPEEEDLTTDIYAEALAIPAPAAAPAPGGTPAVAPTRPLATASIPGLDGYYNDELDEDDDEEAEAKVGSKWRIATFVLVLAVVALVGGLGFTFYTLLTTRSDLNAINAKIPSYAVQIGFKGEDLQGIGYFASDYKRGVLALDGVKPAPAGKMIVVWSTSRKDGTKPVSTLSADRNGGRLYFELRRVPPDVMRIFATLETQGRTLPTTPAGPEVFSGDAPFQTR